MNKSQITEKDIARFWAKVDRRGGNECWNWTAYRNELGYGQFYFGGRLGRASRFSFLIHGGEFTPKKALACHACDNPGCVNPKHLFAGSQSDNMVDARNKGRITYLCGEKHLNHLHPEYVPRGVNQHFAKLNEDDVLRIRAANHVSNRVLGIQFRVDRSTIRDVIQRKTWKHVL
jgi:hypothetical protein